MKPHTLLSGIIVSTCGLTAQLQTTFEACSPTGAFVQADAQPATVSAMPSGTPGTVLDPIAVVADQAQIQTRTKASLRLIEGFPAVRIFETGSAPVLSASMTSRRAGTTSSLRPTSLSPGSHSWILRAKGPPHRRMRLQIRFHSELVGTTVTGEAIVDLGDDGNIEFQQNLDGRRHLENYPVVLDASGDVAVRIETSALLSSALAPALSYTAVLDVSLEPTIPARTTVEPYGTTCGPILTPSTWQTSVDRFVQLDLTNATPNAPALFALGWNPAQVQLPGGCVIWTEVRKLYATMTDATGALSQIFPSISNQIGGDLRMQFGIVDPNNKLWTSNAVRFVAVPDSGAAFDFFDLNHILSTGQSLAVGFGGGLPLSQAQPYANRMFSTGICGAPSNRLVPLVEQLVETHHSGMANWITHVAETDVFKNATVPRNTHAVLVSCHAKSGWPYSLLRKGTAPFSKGIDQVRAAHAIAGQTGRSYVVRAVTNVHGEADDRNGNLRYDKDLAMWQKDYQTEVRAITGQVQRVPMLHSQASAWTVYNKATSLGCILQLRASIDHPRDVVMVGPKYMLDYGTDGLHLTNVGYRHMGEYYGRVYRHVVLEGGTWEPLRPLDAKLNGSVIRVRFHVPAPPLVLDTTMIADPGNFGFEYSDNGSSVPTIAKVELEDEDTVRIALSAVPTGTLRFVRYAYTGVSGASGGATSGPRGNLRDSDGSVSRHGNPLYNWAVHFDHPVR